MSRHVDDRAALFALGALDDDEAATVRAHVAECAACAQAVGAAEADVALAASLEPRYDAPAALDTRVERILSDAGARRFTSSPWPAMLAAAFVIGILPSAWFFAQNRSMHEAMATQSAAMNRLTTETHRVAAFHPMEAMPEGSSAMVAYAPSGEWYVI
ncbi:MAG TPA: zf-HC2 domain-containing protein, partial [Candidatus Cybelea sp.]